jgi:hypothetical protein
MGCCRAPPPPPPSSQYRACTFHSEPYCAGSHARRTVLWLLTHALRAHAQWTIPATRAVRCCSYRPRVNNSTALTRGGRVFNGQHWCPVRSTIAQSSSWRSLVQSLSPFLSGGACPSSLASFPLFIAARISVCPAAHPLSTSPRGGALSPLHSSVHAGGVRAGVGVGADVEARRVVMTMLLPAEHWHVMYPAVEGEHAHLQPHPGELPPPTPAARVAGSSCLTSS